VYCLNILKILLKITIASIRGTYFLSFIFIFLYFYKFNRDKFVFVNMVVTHLCLLAVPIKVSFLFQSTQIVPQVVWNMKVITDTSAK
jgi:hypothetical protein